jgi:hypothetical protein
VNNKKVILSARVNFVLYILYNKGYIYSEFLSSLIAQKDQNEISYVVLRREAPQAPSKWTEVDFRAASVACDSVAIAATGFESG